MRLNRRALMFSGLAAGAMSGGVACAQAPAAQIEPLRRPANGNIKVAVLVDSVSNVMDLASAWEAFLVAGTEQQHCELYTVNPTRAPLRLGGPNGIESTAAYSLDNAPQPHVVVMGAQTGDVSAADTTPQKSEWLRHVAPDADIVMSICTGAFVLARSGLIDHRLATTHHLFYDSFARQFPQVQLVRNRRFVDNGKFVSAGGLTSGIDATLHVIARYWGADESVTIADYLEHYSNDWRTGVRSSA